eukprot:TRINITY_DN69978_c0_g1_i1.p2 TRINITY_DN69978_c0_g1~~TRINITY_DN69978_c0_g1_i1.p2  ORF type:complete len:493 (+),score=55.60 TRINITY_DN69978_c0_g1_i1:88-1566(+)
MGNVSDHPAPTPTVIGATYAFPPELLRGVGISQHGSAQVPQTSKDGTAADAPSVPSPPAGLPPSSSRDAPGTPPSRTPAQHGSPSNSSATRRRPPPSLPEGMEPLQPLRHGLPEDSPESPPLSSRSSTPPEGLRFPANTPRCAPPWWLPLARMLGFTGDDQGPAPPAAAGLPRQPPVPPQAACRPGPAAAPPAAPPAAAPSPAASSPPGAASLPPQGDAAACAGQAAASPRAVCSPEALDHLVDCVLRRYDADDDNCLRLCEWNALCRDLSRPPNTPGEFAEACRLYGSDPHIGVSRAHLLRLATPPVAAELCRLLRGEGPWTPEQRARLLRARASDHGDRVLRGRRSVALWALLQRCGSAPGRPRGPPQRRGGPLSLRSLVATISHYAYGPPPPVWIDITPASPPHPQSQPAGAEPSPWLLCPPSHVWAAFSQEAPPPDGEVAPPHLRVPVGQVGTPPVRSRVAQQECTPNEEFRSFELGRAGRSRRRGLT